ncbi:hypothetical protein DITRI_Ditri08aG0150100 [Diplodiscus trichospermus]
MGAQGDSSESRPCEIGGEEEGVMVNIRCSNGTKISVKTSLESTVGSFKSVLAQNCDIPADQQRLIYKGRILKDDQTLQSYGLQADHTVHMVRGFAPSSSAPPPAATTNVETPGTTPGVTRGVGSNEGAGLGASLFPELNPLAASGALGLFGTGPPEFEQVQQQLTQNPSIMREIMDTPAIQSLMNNPELMRSLIMSNPQMREIIDRNPELGHILNDPSILRQTLEAARNPELMREMMRNTDRAMSNIESSPEGFNMLRRMYENVQEPFLNATTMAGNNGSSPASNPFATLLGNQGVSQARDSSNNASTAGSETTQGQTSPNTNPLPNPWSNTGGRTQTNTTARSNPAGDARATGIAGLGGLGLPDMPPLLNGMPDASQLTQLLQNPAISQITQSMASNPQYMNQILNLNPQLRAMFDLNPQLRDMMQNPEVLRQMFSPETMQQMLALQQSLLSQLNRQQPTQDSAQTGPTTDASGTAGLELLMNMFGGLGAGSLSVPNQPDVPPEELYATQLSQLQEMGFYDTQENIRALRATAGNVHAAVERLLGNSGQIKPHQMVRQTIDSKVSEYGQQNPENNSPTCDKQPPFGAKKTPLRDLQNKNIIVPNSTGSSPFAKDRGPLIDSIKVSGTKRPSPECPVNPSHFVYVRRKSEAELGKCIAFDSTNTSNCQQLRQVGQLEEINQQKSQIKEPKVSCFPAFSALPMAPLTSSSAKLSVPLPLGKSATRIAASESNQLPVVSAAPLLDSPKGIKNFHWEERYYHLQMLLKKLDQSDLEDYNQMLRSLNAVELSRHAFELEKRSIQLSLEEAKEVQRVGILNVLGKTMKTAKAPYNQPDQSYK